MPLTQDSFESLLAWLHSDREAAGRKYETIRSGLIRIFISKGLSDAEHLADEVINRVAARLPELAHGYVGEPENYFRGVARKLILEAGRCRELATGMLPEPPTCAPADVSDEYLCLLRCLEGFDPDKRELVLDYYVYVGGGSVANHREMARERRVSESNLRVQAFRAKRRLEQCVSKCLEELNGKRKPL